MRVIGLDVGRSKVKVFSDGVQLSFPSYCGAYRPLRLERSMTNDDMVVHWNGSNYYVGEIAKDESDDGIQNFLTSKVTVDTKLIGLTAIHRIVKDNEEISMVVGHPIENHTNPEKEGMRQLFGGSHELIVNGVNKRFFIAPVTVVPEGATAQFLLQEKYTTAHGIDAGGATTNYATWQRGKWIDKLSGTLPFGLENTNLPIDQFARLVANHVAKKLNQFKGPIFTLGGAAQPLAIALQNYIRNIPITPLDDGLYVNAKAYYEIGVKLHEKQKAQNIQAK